MANCRKMNDLKNFLECNLFLHLLWSLTSSWVFKIGLPPIWSFNKRGPWEYGRLSSLCVETRGQLTFQAANQPPVPKKLEPSCPIRSLAFKARQVAIQIESVVVGMI